MGCTQSTALKTSDPMHIGKSERGPRTGTKGVSMKSMQTSVSNGAPAFNPYEDSIQPPKLNGDGKLTTEEVLRRTSSSSNVTSVTIGNQVKSGKSVHVQFASRSQRGYYPDDPMKANQDKYGITLNFAGEDGDALFAVYDGHGTEGHDCATFAKKKLPQAIAKYVKQTRAKRFMDDLNKEGKTTKAVWNPKLWPLLNVQEFEACCRKGFIETNQAMHDEKSVEDKLSGTTAATVCFHGGRMTVCNVGDSRVVLGHRVASLAKREEKKKEEKKSEIETRSEEILPIPLTRDQTPYRKDERERVRKHGAEVKSIDQMEGREEVHDNWGDIVLGERVDIEGDPPRVWVQGNDYPGTAFTRSLGDTIAEDIGVMADPEILTKDLTVNDEFLVIASDGIFEFLTNQEVMNICSASMDPIQACEKLTKASYDQWLTHENRTDDITVIVCFLTSAYEPTAEAEIETTKALVATANDVYGSKPLRSMLKSSSTS